MEKPVRAPGPPPRPLEVVPAARFLAPDQGFAVAGGVGLAENANHSRYLPVMIPLHQLAPGDDATVAAIHADAALRSRLAALGVRIGQRVRMVRKGRFAGPLHIRLGTTDVILRHRQAGQIEVAR
jgi:Fe2+ transport system protein FeoA